METAHATEGGRACAVHPGRGAVERCRSCGRAVCLGCAIPFRGRVLCTRCAAQELGEPSPPEAPTIRSRRPHVPAAVLFAVGIAGTIWPWDRFGALTGFFSAWSLATPWSLAASVLLAAAAAIAVIAPWLPGRIAALAYTLLGTLAFLAAVRAVYGSPEFVRHTPAPYVVLAGAAAGVVAGVIRLRQERAA